MSNDQKHVRIHVAQSLFEAQQVQQLLDQAGIPNILIPYSDTALDGLYLPSRGFGEIKVLETQEAQARAVLEEGLPGILEVDQEHLEREATRAPPSEPSPVAGSATWLLKLLVALAVLVILYLLWETLTS